MIQTETVTIRNRDFLHTYSDTMMMILQKETGTLYAEAYDLPDNPYHYTETNIPIDKEESL